MSEVAGYEVLREDVTLALPPELLGSVTLTGYLDTSAQAGWSYLYTVRAFDAAGNVGFESAPVALTLGPPAPPIVPAPVNLVIAWLDGPSGSVTLKWNYPSDESIEVIGFEVFRNGTRLVDFQAGGRPGIVTKRRYIDSQLDTRETYIYTVRAVAANKDRSEFSDSVTLSFNTTDRGHRRRATQVQEQSQLCTAGSCYVLSRSSNLTADERVFASSDTLHIGMFSDSIDATDIRKAEYELKDASKNKLKANFSNDGNGAFSAAIDLNTLPSNLTTWSWKGKLEDEDRNKYEVSDSITVNP